MCTVFVLRDLLAGHPVVIAANRDELLARPWSPPLPVRAPRPAEVDAVMPIDDVAGGTWLGVNAAGVLLAVTNRLPGGVDRTLPSRGLLAKQALHQASLAAAEAVVRAAVGRSRFNGFNVLLADARRTRIMSLRDGAPHLDELDPGPGVHVITSRHDLDPAVLDDLRRELDAGARAAASLAALMPLVQRVLADHAERDVLYTVCKHGDTYGTRSAAVLAVTPDGAPRMWFAPGRPCEIDLKPVPVELAAPRPR